MNRMVQLVSANPHPVPGPRPQVPFPNQHFSQIADLATFLWSRRERRPDGILQCQNIRNLITQLIEVGDITNYQGGTMFNALNGLDHFDWINNDIYAWQDAWYAFRQALGDAGCPGAYFVLLDEEFMP